MKRIFADSSHPVLTLHKIGCKCNSGHRCQHFIHHSTAILHWQENIRQLQRYRKVDRSQSLEDDRNLTRDACHKALRMGGPLQRKNIKFERSGIKVIE